MARAAASAADQLSPRRARAALLPRARTALLLRRRSTAARLAASAPRDHDVNRSNAKIGGRAALRPRPASGAETAVEWPAPPASRRDVGESSHCVACAQTRGEMLAQPRSATDASVRGFKRAPVGDAHRADWKVGAARCTDFGTPPAFMPDLLGGCATSRPRSFPDPRASGRADSGAPPPSRSAPLSAPLGRPPSAPPAGPRLGRRRFLESLLRRFACDCSLTTWWSLSRCRQRLRLSAFPRETRLPALSCPRRRCRLRLNASAPTARSNGDSQPRRDPA